MVLEVKSQCVVTVNFADRHHLYVTLSSEFKDDIEIIRIQ
jgi:hypothetical protein